MGASEKIERLFTIPRMYYLPAKQPNNNVRGLYDMMKEISNPNWIMVEVGSFAGVSSMLFAEMVKFLFCIDPYEEYSELDINKISTAKELFQKNISNYSNYKLLIEYSIEASEKFNNNYFDMVYLDGAHNQRSVREDLMAWIPKIKKGGWICGHDIDIDVKIPVIELFGNDIKTYSDTSWAHQIK